MSEQQSGEASGGVDMQRTTRKQAYDRPQLTVLGTVDEVTRGAGSALTDGTSFRPKPTGPADSLAFSSDRALKRDIRLLDSDAVLRAVATRHG